MKLIPRILTRVPVHRRRGVIIILLAAALIMIFAFAAFTVDVGYITVAKAQIQNAADGAALASCIELGAGFGPGATISANNLVPTAEQAAVTVTADNRVADVQSAYCNGSRDVQLGLYQWNGTSWTKNWGTTPYNMAQVTLHRDVAGNGGDRPLPLFFAPVFGDKTANVEASAIAALLPGVGFTIPASTPSAYAPILPIALDQGTWNSLMAGVGTDNYAYNPATGAVTAGSDGILEVSLYPSGSSSMPPGNRGIVNIGNNSNSASIISNQIQYGISATDLAPYGGTINFNPSSPLVLSGVPGLKASIKAALTAIIGQPRAIPLFSSVTGNGANATYTIPKFVGVRVLAVSLTGNNKYVTVQPAPIVDPTVVPGNVPVTQDSILYPGSLVQ